MNDHDAFLEFIGNLEYLRKHKKLTPDAAHAILSGVPLTIYDGQAGSPEPCGGAGKASASTSASTTSTKTKAIEGGATATDASGAKVSSNP